VSNPSFQFPATRAAASAQLREFLPRIPEYAQSRNRVAPGHAGVSRLSPALASRLLTEDEIIAETLAKFPAAQAEKWLQEIFWRRYWKGWLEQHPKVWSLYQDRVVWLRAEEKPAVLQRAEAVAAGRSGVALMDRFARELVETGYLHNHARMWWASFWVHVEHLPWELGADFFSRHLLDADAASNTLSWRWVAGIQTRGKPYLVRRTNLDRYCAPELLADTTGLERLADDVVTSFFPPAPKVPKAVLAEVEDEDEDETDEEEGEETSPPAVKSVGAQAKAALPEKVLTWAERETEALTAQRFASHPSKPPEITGRLGLWIHEEDVTPELSNLGILKPVSCAAFAVTAPGREPAPLAAGYREALLADAVARAEAHFGVPAAIRPATSWAQGLLEWARSERLVTLCALAPNVGPLAAQLPAIRAVLREAGIELLLFRRYTDFELWPHATSGYFKFWEAAQLWLRAKQKRGELPPSPGKV
jgi:hypothetical protein